MKRELSHSTPNPLARPNSLTRPNTHTPHALPTLTPPNTACNDDSLTLRRTTCISNANSTPALTSASRASRASRCPSLDTDPGVAPSLSPPPPDPPARHDPPLLSASSHIDVTLTRLSRKEKSAQVVERREEGRREGDTEKVEEERKKGSVQVGKRKGPSKQIKQMR
eukprot:3441079-Rhodomonas_salina.1